MVRGKINVSFVYKEVGVMSFMDGKYKECEVLLRLRWYFLNLLKFRYLREISNRRVNM